MKLQSLLLFVSTISLFIQSVPALPINMVPQYTTQFSPRDINILSLGDWGSASLGGYHLRNAESTAYAMKIYASEYNPKLVLNTGDNFYYCGIQNTSDPQVNAMSTHNNIRRSIAHSYSLINCITQLDRML